MSATHRSVRSAPPTVHAFKRKTRRAAQLLGIHDRTALTPGPPPGVTRESLTQLCLERFGSPLASVGHQHTSGWKSSGAYRVAITSADGRTHEIFCKLNDHRPEAIASLLDFPAHVGPPELAVLEAGAAPELRDHVPALYRCYRLGPSQSIIFMEALGRSWHACTAWSPDVVRAAAEAGAVQQVLTRSFERSPSASLIKYDADFSERLNHYANVQLRRLTEQTEVPVAKTVLAQWDELSRLYLPAGRRSHHAVVVHGDFNPANVFLHVTRRRVKVIDWEWAGTGDGYRDLAALLKRASPQVERRALSVYHRVVGGEPDWRRYERSQLERGLLDAAFFSAQLVASSLPVVNMTQYVGSSLRRAAEAARALES